MPTITVRQAVVADLDALVPLFDAYRRFYGKDSAPAAARRFLLDRFDHGESVLLIAEADGRPAGFTQLYPSFSSLSMGRIFVLNDLFVDAAARRLGVGSRLLDAAAGFARALDAVALTLSTATGNTAAQALYEGAGWQRDTAFYTYDLRLAR
jgi:ribosomal protein S18 acetylase RimI-like enzyme